MPSFNAIRGAAVSALMLTAAPVRGQDTQAEVVASATPSSPSGQSLGTIAPNSRVRIDVATTDTARAGRFAPITRFGREDRSQPVIGALAAVEGDVVLLSVRSGADPVRVPRTAIRGVYVSRGKPPRLEAALRGAVAPALIGAAVAALTTSLRREEGRPGPAQAAAASAAWGAAWGAVRGAWSPKERWQRVPLPAAAPAGARSIESARGPAGMGERASR